jgi:hypothetical protein
MKGLILMPKTEYIIEIEKLLPLADVDLLDLLLKLLLKSS